MSFFQVSVLPFIDCANIYRWNLTLGEQVRAVAQPSMQFGKFGSRGPERDLRREAMRLWPALAATDTIRVHGVLTPFVYMAYLPRHCAWPYRTFQADSGKRVQGDR